MDSPTEGVNRAIGASEVIVTTVETCARLTELVTNLTSRVERLELFLSQIEEEVSRIRQGG